jgi:hypothetical protein
MRKFVGLLVLVTMLVGLVALAGCGAKEGGISTTEGKIVYKDGKITVTGAKSGTESTWSVSTTSEKALGVPVPDKAELEKGSIAVIEAGGTPNEKWAGATFWSDESTEQLISWYRGELSSMTGFSDTSTVLDGQQVGLFSVGAGDSVKSVIVTAGMSGDPGKSKIVIGTATGVGVSGK